MGSFFQELFRVGLYKRSQGRIARQVTFAALTIIIAAGCWSLSEFLGQYATQYPDWNAATRNAVRFLIPLVLLVMGAWASFRMVQLPAFADFLISVEGEMNKVSWPARGELFRASIVVMVVIFFLAAVLYMYDAVLRWLLNGAEQLVTRIFG